VRDRGENQKRRETVVADPIVYAVFGVENAAPARFQKGLGDKSVHTFTQSTQLDRIIV
jgi:hypothetical protein